MAQDWWILGHRTLAANVPMRTLQEFLSQLRFISSDAQLLLGKREPHHQYPIDNWQNHTDDY